MKKQRGITIVSLVVTIIVLIILAGVSISAIWGEDGIITIAKQAKENVELAQKEEQTKLNELYTQIEIEEDSLGDTSYESSSKLIEFKKKIAEAITKSGIETDESATADVMANNIEQLSNSSSSVYYVTLSDGNQLPVPKGFYYVGGTIVSGAVISDEINDREKYKNEEDVPAGVAYNSDGTVDIENSTLKGNQFVWIPCTLENYTKVDFGKTNSSGWDTSTNTAEEAQIRMYGGFYVGRYEAGTSNIVLQDDVKFENVSTASDWHNGNFLSSKVTSGKITCKAGEIPYYHADYTTAVEMSKNMYNTDSVNSGLMTGTMWDAMMKFITTDPTSYSDLKNTSWGNYNTNTVAYTAGNGRYLTVNSTSGAVTSNATVADASYHYGIRTTAATEGVKRNNLYDIAGNLWEWTQEMAYYSSSTNYYMLRGGSFAHSYSPGTVCYRDARLASYARTHDGFRPALYIR